MALVGFDFDAFPQLVFHPSRGDRSTCFKKWLNRFQLSVEMMTYKLGNEAVADGNGVYLPKFRGRIKVLSLLNVIGQDGLDALSSVGFDFNSEEADYNEALRALQSVFERTESDYVKTNKFISARQLSDEDEVEFYHRVEKLSRALNFGENNEIRKQIALSIAVCGLRDADLRRSLMSEEDMTWDSFCTKSKNKVTAKESEEYLFGNGANSSYHNMGKFENKLSIKQEVDLVDSDKKIDSKYSKYRHPNFKSYSNGSDSVESYDESTIRNVSLKSNNKRKRTCSNSNSSCDTFLPDWMKSNLSHKAYKNRDALSRSNTYAVGRCIGCNRKGHFLRECPYIRCFNCQEKGHTSIDCKRKKYQISVRNYRRSSKPTHNLSDNGSERKSSRSVYFANSDEELIDDNSEYSDLDEEAGYDTASEGQEAETDLSDTHTIFKPKRFKDMVYDL